MQETVFLGQNSGEVTYMGDKRTDYIKDVRKEARLYQLG